MSPKMCDLFNTYYVIDSSRFFSVEVLQTLQKVFETVNLIL